ncbi:TetR/AcrR family transcriptional regulator [Bordetella genomosp. 7]|uniref:TetR/AcrR family transcriptional regulator n=1 Tax=Bordetella genomosp. 7 TaxID=1416805 RepID=UPI0020160608|nr:TetR/AcrR family transcriptional regulator [Bordetella genomosp. 7]
MYHCWPICALDDMSVTYQSAEAFRAGKGARTRQRLLDIACEEFARLGYERVRVSEIASKAGITQSVFYQYFGGKRSIYDELIDMFAMRLRQAVEQAKIPEDTPIELLEGRARNSVRRLLGVLHENHSLAKLGFQHSEHAEALKSELVDLLAQKVKEEQQMGLLRRDVSPYWLSQAFVGIMERFAMLEQDAASLGELSAFISDLLMNGVRPRDSGQADRVPAAPHPQHAQPGDRG